VVGRLLADNRIQLGISFSKDSEWQSYKDWILFKPKFLPKKNHPKGRDGFQLYKKCILETIA